ncbi:MAG: ATP-binding protein [Pseudomonadota bacterium]
MEIHAVCEPSEMSPDYMKRAQSVSQDVQYLMWLLRHRARHISRTMSWEYVAMGIAEINEVARCAAELVRELDSKPISRNVGLLLGQSIKYMQTLLRTVASPQVSLRYDFQSAREAPVRISEAALQQIMINLVSNARNAGAGVVTIAVSYESSGTGQTQADTPSGRARVTVTDDGCGLREELADQALGLAVFDEEPDWFGTGLATVRSIARANDGELGMRNQPGAGLLAEVCLPTM